MNMYKLRSEIDPSNAAARNSVRVPRTQLRRNMEHSSAGLEQVGAWDRSDALQLQFLR